MNYSSTGSILPPATGGGLIAYGSGESYAWMIILGLTLVLMSIAILTIPKVTSGGFSTWRNGRIDPYMVAQPNWRTTSMHILKRGSRIYGSTIKNELRRQNRRH